MTTECQFCHGRPIINARVWIALNQPRFTPCPRCGLTFTNEEADAVRAADTARREGSPG
jgi:hypothetical protein